MADDLKTIYHAATLEEAEHQLAEFEETWAVSYPVIAKSWRANWARVVPMFGYPAEIRRAVKYEEVYLHDYAGPRQARDGLTRYLEFYNDEHPHQALAYRTPAEAYRGARRDT